jgi:hypothetical protein
MYQFATQNAFMDTPDPFAQGYARTIRETSFMNGPRQMSKCTRECIMDYPPPVAPSKALLLTCPLLLCRMRLFHAGELSQAILAFEAELTARPENAEAWRMLGTSHAENDEDKRAIACLERAVEHVRPSSSIYLCVYYGLGISGGWKVGVHSCGIQHA